jgi:hypothetical protein
MRNEKGILKRGGSLTIGYFDDLEDELLKKNMRRILKIKKS